MAVTLAAMATGGVGTMAAPVDSRMAATPKSNGRGRRRIVPPRGLDVRDDKAGCADGATRPRIRCREPACWLMRTPSPPGWPDDRVKQCAGNLGPSLPTDSAGAHYLNG